MAGTTISELGKMFNQSTQSVQGTESNTRITTGKVDFGSMMKQSGNRQTASYAGIDHNETVKTAANGSKDTVKAADDYQKYQYKDNTIASEIKQVTSEDVVKEQFEQFTEDVKEVLKEELGVSDEAIEAAMQTLGLQFQDLLNQNNLANLVAELTGADSVPQLLCSEQFVNVLQSVNDIGKDILNALDMSLEEFQSAVAKVMDDNAGSSDAVTGQETEASVDEAVVTDQTVTEDTGASTQKFVVEDGRQTKAAENAPAQDTQSSEVTEDIPEQETVQNRMTSENAAEDSTDQNDSSDTPGRFRFTNETAHTADGAVITPQSHVVQEFANVETVEPLPQSVNTQSSEVTEDIPEQETVQNRMTSENAAEDSTDQNDSSDTPGRFRFTNETAHTADGAVITPQSHVVQEFANVETVEPLPQSVNTQDVIDQIVESARVILTEDKTSMELQLNPQNLGKIILKVTEQEGAVTAKIMTQNAVVKEALEAQTVELRQNLEQAGVKVDAVEVTVASHEFEKNLEQNAEGEKQQGEQQEKEKGRTRRLNLNDLSELSGVMSEEETLAAKMMAEQGNSVDYTA